MGYFHMRREGECGHVEGALKFIILPRTKKTGVERKGFSCVSGLGSLG